MKKLAFLIGLFTIVSCSNSDNTGVSSKSDFHPPAWIQGNWAQENVGSNGTLFSFTANDFCITSAGVVKQCQEEYSNQVRKSGMNVTVTETITPTIYTAEINFSGNSSIYSFKKLANDRIEWTAVPGSSFKKQ